ncbi:MAG: HNH endonuclease [Lachnospiraceae bacterium]|nr:HNH endonuclease [Lachnospiraceae bacterium]
MAIPVVGNIYKAIEGVETISKTESMGEIVADAEKLTEGLWPKIEKQEGAQPLSPEKICREAWKKTDVEEKPSAFDIPRRITTRNEIFENERHPITNVLFKRRTIELPDGEKVEGVFPEFKSMFDVKLPENMYLLPDRLQFRECNRQLAQEIDKNPELKKLFSEEQIEQIRDGIQDGTAPDGYVWHHDAETGKMQLVDFETHSRTAHTGGRVLWGGGSDFR